MIKLFYGNEPYYLVSIRKKLADEKNGIDVCMTESVETAVKEAFMPSFFEPERIVILLLDKLQGQEELSAYVDRPCKSCSFYIFANQVDRRSKLYKKLEQCAQIRVCDKLSNQKLREWCMGFAGSRGGHMEPSVLDVFLRRVGYYEDESCSLFTVKNYLIQLTDLEQEITEATVEKVVPAAMHEKMYVLGSYILKNCPKEAFALMYAMLGEGESPISMLSALLRTFRLAYKAHLFREHGKKELEQMLGVPEYQYRDAMPYGSEKTVRCMECAQESVNRIKCGYPKEQVMVSAMGHLLCILHG